MERHEQNSKSKKVNAPPHDFMLTVTVSCDELKKRKCSHFQSEVTRIVLIKSGDVAQLCGKYFSAISNNMRLFMLLKDVEKIFYSIGLLHTFKTLVRTVKFH
jgi:hypothetical protein